MLALRLLGIRRGWARAALAGLIGWTIGLLLGLAVADWDWGTDGLALHVLAFSIPATMAVAVAFDLLAQPGTLATGERAGPGGHPPPLPRACASRSPCCSATASSCASPARRASPRPWPAEASTPAPPDPVGVRLRRALEEAGGVYVKLGQIAATRVDLLPAQLCEELGQLQNRVAPESAENMRAVLEEEFGRPVEETFAAFDWDPIAAASIGQTYGAQLHSGEAVVVKVQRPGVDDVIERDLAALVAARRARAASDAARPERAVR